MSSPIILCRLPIDIRPDSSRVLVRPFLPADPHRVVKILTRVLSLSDAEADALLAQVFAEFGDRHLELQQILLDRFEQVQGYLPMDKPLSETRRLLIGSYFTNEYSFESAALFNPSIVEHPDQSGVEPGALRFIMSLRATGEGHLSSIAFRSGMISANGDVSVDTPSRFVTEPKPIPSAHYESDLFQRKLAELALDTPFTQQVLASLGQEFTLDRLQATISELSHYHTEAHVVAEGTRMVLLAKSNYTTEFSPRQSISERTIFPFSPSQSNGMEDARFVRFVDDHGDASYVATYTAYDGRVILPQILETKNFLRFRVSTLNGPAVQNKGMALFPRKIRGHYCMLSRQDNENIHLMYSDHSHFWYESQVIMRPDEPWEFVQLGNCGSPIETPAGWLVLTHGVGPMRKYCISAILLDLDDPTKIIGRLRDPLIRPEPGEREGYVPNVVYTCGAIVHGGHLIIPYAISDSVTTFATTELDALLDALLT